MLKAVDYCHQNSVVHCDLKLENFMLDFEGKKISVKLGDFGMAKHHRYGDEPTLLGVEGTLAFMAPEII